MRSEFLYDTLSTLKGKDVCASDGEKIGTVKDIFYAGESRKAEWIGLGSGFLGLKELVVPLEDARLDGDVITVGFAKKIVQDEPDFDEKDGVLTPKSEQELCDYFGVTGHKTTPHTLSRYDFPGS